MRRQAIIYGIVVFGAIFFVGWVTGMGGAFVPNLVFSAVMGLFAGGIYFLVQRKARGSEK